METYKTIEATNLQEYNDKLNELADKGYRVVLSSVNYNDDKNSLDYFCATMQLDPRKQELIQAEKNIDRIIKIVVEKTVKQLQNKQQDSE